MNRCVTVDQKIFDQWIVGVDVLIAWTDLEFPNLAVIWYEVPEPQGSFVDADDPYID